MESAEATRTCIRRGRCFAVLAILSLGISSLAPTHPSPASAQEHDEPSLTDEADERDPAEEAREQLRGAHLGELASRTRTVLQRARPLLRASQEISHIERHLPRAESQVDRLAHPARLARIATLSQRELADQRQEWRHHGTTFAAWQTTLLERIAALEEVRAEIVGLRRHWATLRQTSELAGRPAGRHERIVTSLEEVRSAAAELDSQRELVLGLQDRVSELSLAVDDSMEQLRAASQAYRERLFLRDRPPIWEGLSSDPSAESLSTQVQTSWSLRSDAALTMMAAEIPALARQSVLFVAILGLTILLGRRRGKASDAEKKLSLRLIERPISIALLVTLLLTPFAVRNAPVIVYDVVFLFSLVPLTRVLAPLTPPYARSALYVVAAFLGVLRLEIMTPDGSELRRVLVLVESSLGALALGYWLYARMSVVDRLAPILRSAAVLSAVLVVAAFIANVVGYAFLSTVLMRGTAFSIYAALTVIGAMAVLRGLLELVTRSSSEYRLRSLREHGALIRARTERLLSIAGMALWVAATLDGYDLLTPISKSLEEFLERTWEVGSVHVSFGGVGRALLIFGATMVLTRFVRFVLEVDVLPALRLEPGVDGAISGLTSYVVFAAGLLLTLASLGIDASQIALVAGALGVGIGFGLQGIVANMIAGLVLMLERPVRLGDFIEVGPLVGRVERIGLRSSTVRAFDGAEVIVPNESLISRELVNWTLSDRKRRVQIKIGVAYGTDPKRAMEIIKGVADTHVGKVGDAAPNANFEGFGESSLDFTLEFWTADYVDARQLRSDIGLKLHEALAEAGIEIPFPQRDLHIKSVPDSVVGSADTQMKRAT